jgi:cytoskeleton protein RodZ
VTRHSIGALLKSERETRDLSIEELSSTTRIPRRTLESLEDDRFEDLPSGVFVRGFIKAYASVVDIDAREVLARFDEQRPTSTLTPPLAGIHRNRSSVWLLAITMAALFAIIVATFVMVRRAPAQNEPIELSSAQPCQVEQERAEPYSYVPSIIATPIASSRC